MQKFFGLYSIETIEATRYLIVQRASAANALEGSFRKKPTFKVCFGVVVQQVNFYNTAFSVGIFS